MYPRTTGRNWPRHTIEELVDDEVRAMIKRGEITPPDPGDHGAVLPDGGQPFNNPVSIVGIRPTTASTSFAIDRMGEIRSSYFNGLDQGYKDSTVLIDNRLAPHDRTPYGHDMPIISAFNNHEQLRNTDMAYSFAQYSGFCARMKVSSRFYQNYMIRLGGSFSDHGHWNAGTLYEDDFLYSPADYFCIPVPAFSTSYQSLWSNDAIQAKMVIGYYTPYVDQMLYGATEVFVFDNPPPFYFCGMNGGSSVDVTLGNNKYPTGGLGIVYCMLGVLMRDATIDRYHAFLNHEIFNDINFVNIYTISMNDENLKLFVNPNSPESVTVTHINMGW